jgi:hypothetical protein
MDAGVNQSRGEDEELLGVLGDQARELYRLGWTMGIDA